jgi:hypothetical protein
MKVINSSFIPTSMIMLGTEKPTIELKVVFWRHIQEWKRNSHPFHVVPDVPNSGKQAILGTGFE